MPSNISCFDHGNETGVPYARTGPNANVLSHISCFDHCTGTGAPYTRTGPEANVPSRSLCFDHITETGACVLGLVPRPMCTHAAHALTLALGLVPHILGLVPSQMALTQLIF